MKRWILIALVASSCASVPLKQKAVLGLQASEVALESAHDIERGLCFVAPSTEKGNHCTSATAAQIGLTDERHADLARRFEAAFAVEKQAAIALTAWKAGDPSPTTVDAYREDIAAILSLARQLLPSATTFIGKVQLAVDEGAAIALLVGVR